MAQKRQKVFITGAGGFLGSHLSDAFLLNGFDVCGTVLHGKERLKHLKDHAQFKAISLDLTDAEKTAKAVAAYAPDALVHAAAYNPPTPATSSVPYMEGNVRATVSVLNAAKNAGVKKLVYISSMSVYDKKQLTLPVSEESPVHPNDFYSATKYMGEEWCTLYGELFGIRTTVLRCAGIYGPRRGYGAVSNFIAQALAGKSLELERDIGWDLVYVKDVAASVLQSVELSSVRPYDLFNIGSGVETNIKELASLVIRETGSRSTVTLSPDFEKQTPSHFYFDISKAQKILSFTPTPLEKGIQESISRTYTHPSSPKTASAPLIRGE